MDPAAARQALGLNDAQPDATEVESAWRARSLELRDQLGSASPETRPQIEAQLAGLAAAKMALLAIRSSGFPSAVPAVAVATASMPPSAETVRPSGLPSRAPSAGGAPSGGPPLPDYTASVLADMTARSLLGGVTPAPNATPPPPAAAAVSFAVGSVLAGRYEIRGWLGQGGMGVVYSAVDRLKRNEAIAVKILTPALTANPVAKERFINEAIIATRLNHSGIVKVHAPEQHGDLIFLTMEKLEGRSLRQVLEECRQRGVQLTVTEVVRIGRLMCEALHYAHRLATPIVHRDIKPENIFICEDGSVRLMDFGLAQNVSGPQLTAVATTMGTMHYMAPEQTVDARNVDHRADQYALAVTLYEMLTGRIPQGSFPEPRAARKTIPAGLSAAVMRGLNSAPGKRFPDMAAFRAQLKDHDAFLGQLLAGKNRDLIATGALVVVLLGGAAYFAVTKMQKVATPPPAAGGFATQPKKTGTKATTPVPATRPADNRPAPAATGGISVTTTPPGAEVTVGSQFAGNSPARFANVPVGRYPVRVLLRDYKEVNFEIEVVAGTFASKVLTLEPRLAYSDPAVFYQDTLTLMREAEESDRLGAADVAREKWREALERFKFLAAKSKNWQPLVVAQRVRECEANLQAAR